MTNSTTQSTLQTISLAVQGFGVGLLLVLLSQQGVAVGGLHFGFTFVPVAALLFWPKHASKAWSTIFVFLLGLFHDATSFGPTGLWAFCYVSIFTLLRTEFSNLSRLARAYGAYFTYLSLMLIPLFVLGRLILGSWPPWIPVGADLLVSLSVFPVIYWFRSLLLAIRTEPTERETA